MALGFMIIVNKKNVFTECQQALSIVKVYCIIVFIALFVEYP